MAASPDPLVLPSSSKLSRTGVSPTVVAWSVVGVMMVLFGWSLWDSDEPPSATSVDEQAKSTRPAAFDTSQQDQGTSPNVPTAEPTSAQPDSAPPDPEPNVDEPIPVDAPPPPDSVSQALDSYIKKEPQTEEPAAPPVPTEAERLAAAQSARDAEAVASIRNRLALPLASYEMAKPLSLGMFLDEVSRLAATWINTNGLGQRLEKPVQVKLADTTLDAVLAAGLEQVGLDFEVLPTGIHLSR